MNNGNAVEVTCTKKCGLINSDNTLLKRKPVSSVFTNQVGVYEIYQTTYIINKLFRGLFARLVLGNTSREGVDLLPS